MFQFWIPESNSRNQGCYQYIPRDILLRVSSSHPLREGKSPLKIFFRTETNIRNVTNEPFSKRTNIRIFVRFDE